jgi:hypothetical protein
MTIKKQKTRSLGLAVFLIVKGFPQTIVLAETVSAVSPMKFFAISDLPTLLPALRKPNLCGKASR